MEVVKSVTEKVVWDIDLCDASAVIRHRQGKIMEQIVAIVKTCPVTQSKQRSSFYSDDPQFIRDVHKALGEYIQHLDNIMRGCRVESEDVDFNELGGDV